MVRTYKRKTQWTSKPVQNMKDAVEAVKEGLSFREAARMFSVSKSSLGRAMSRGKISSLTSQCNTRQVFTNAEEQELVEYIIQASKYGFPIDSMTLRSLAFDLANKNLKVCPPSWTRNKRAGEDWVLAFRKRHPEISIRIPEAVSLARMMAFNRNNVDEFFKKLQHLYEKHTLTPDRIFNTDETALMTSLKPTKVLAQSGVKQVSQVVSQERGELVTMLAIVNAIGNSIPPCLIFPRVNFHDHMTINAPPGTKGLGSRSGGWMTKSLFVECLEHFTEHVNCSPDNKVLLILDNHESHISLAAINHCREKGVVLLSLPPHCTHRMQPLDVGVFGPLKTEYNKALSRWMYMHPGTRTTIHHVSTILGSAYPRAFRMENIISGFKATGIYPLDSEMFSKELAEEAESAHLQEQPQEPTCQQEQLPEPPHQQEQPPASPLQQEQPRASPLQQEQPPSPPISVEEVESSFSHAPADVRPHASVPKNSRKRKGRPLGSSRILTDTPEKNIIEENVSAKKKKAEKTASQSRKRAPSQPAKATARRSKTPRTVLQATYHQGSSVFNDRTRGRQCVGMATSAVAYAEIKDMSTWTKEDLDLVLLFGDYMYQKMLDDEEDNVQGYLQLSDIPAQINLFNKNFHVSRSAHACGVVGLGPSFSEAFSLSGAIKRAFDNFPSMILVLKETSVMIHKSTDSFWLFDSHSRNQNGMPSANGKGVLMKFQDLDDLLKFLTEMSKAISSGVVTFDSAGFQVTETDDQPEQQPPDQPEQQPPDHPEQQPPDQPEQQPPDQPEQQPPDQPEQQPPDQPEQQPPDQPEQQPPGQPEQQQLQPEHVKQLV
ncbi:hypothetical protein V1264_004989 [Littorina saxatilis]|uniref:HTH CENPB-type domain-containing protein n=1 Tax=Littorina saxatilis TaxID=31220 RepID=A0AAN9G5M4_9CAEN